MALRFIVTSTFVFGVCSSVLACGSDDDKGSDSAPSSGGTRAEGGSSNGARGGSTGRGGSGGSGGSSADGGRNGRGGSGATTAGSSGSAGEGDGNDTPGPTLGGCPLFPADDAWNTDISDAPVDKAWTDRLHALVGNNTRLHPDYGRDGSFLYGIPINVVPENQPAANVSIDWYPEESDEGPYPFPPPDKAKIEGNDPFNCDGDCHLLVVQEGTCKLYEGYACEFDDDTWRCGSGAIWDLTKDSYGQRPEGWTSADAAGLPVTPGLLRYDEVAAREVRHALRFTVRCTRANYVAPATHYAVPSGCDKNDPNAPPMGLRVRLSASFDESGFSEGARAVVRALKRYGMILADNGSNFFFQGEAHPDWDLDEIEELKRIPASAFEVIEPPPLMP